MVRVKFTSHGSSARYGNFAPGDLVSCSAAEAEHFVKDAMCAQYDEQHPIAKQPEAKKTAGKKKDAA